MTRFIAFLLFGIFLLNACEIDFNTSESDLPVFKNIPFSYPVTQKDTSIKDNYHGVSVNDPYRWLEQENTVNTKIRFLPPKHYSEERSCVALCM